MNVMMTNCLVTLNEIEARRHRLDGVVFVTPCPDSMALSELMRCRVFWKLEYLQHTGHFNERGAANVLALLPEDGILPNTHRGI